MGSDMSDHSIGVGLAGGVVDNDGGALGSQRLGNPGADTFRGTRYYRDFSVEFHTVTF